MKEKKEKLKHSLYFRKGDLDNIGKSTWNPTVREWRDVIEDYIYIAKKRKNKKFSMFKLQLDIISDMVLINDTIKGYISFIESDKAREKKFPGIVFTDEHFEYWEEEIKAHKIILNALKDIGDGIAWRLFDYDRPLIYNMCINNQAAGPLTLTNGFVIELKSISDYTSDPEIEMFVYHGITNFLNVGDISKKYISGDINLTEVKSGKNARGESWKKRLERQEERRENIVSLANKGVGKAVNIPIRIEIISGKPKTITNRLKTLLNQALKASYISQQYYSYLTVSVLNYEHITDDSWKEKLDKAKRSVSQREEDIIIMHDSIKTFEFSVNRAPWSIFPFSAEILSNILMGKFVVIYHFNVSEFARKITNEGWIVSDLIYKRNDKNDNPSMFTVSKNHMNIAFPPLLASRAIYEGLAMESIIKIFEDLLGKGFDESYAYFNGFEKEKYLWE